MAKFKVGDRVRIIRNTLCHGFDVGYEGVLEEVREVPGYAQRLKMDDMWVSGDVEPATPTEHPALTLAKAEVVRLYEVSERTNSQDAMLCAYEKVLHACGLRYRRTVEFVSIDRQEDAV